MIEERILLVDIGNSTSVAAVPSKNGFKRIFSEPTEQLKQVLDAMDIQQYSRVIVSSVVPSMAFLFDRFENVLFLDHLKLPKLRLNVDHPEQVGADRLVNALGALRTYSLPCLIIDSGTALTFCVVDKKGVYQGGAIFPGMGISSRALSLFTAKIPYIPVTKQTELVGKDTQSAVECGLYHGYVHLINGMIATYKRAYSDLTVVGTGSGLNILEDQLDVDVLDGDLIFKGLCACV